jgi:hypothetical protein
VSPYHLLLSHINFGCNGLPRAALWIRRTIYSLHLAWAVWPRQRWLRITDQYAGLHKNLFQSLKLRSFSVEHLSTFLDCQTPGSRLSTSPHPLGLPSNRIESNLIRVRFARIKSGFKIVRFVRTKSGFVDYELIRRI